MNNGKITAYGNTAHFSPVYAQPDSLREASRVRQVARKCVCLFIWRVPYAPHNKVEARSGITAIAQP